MGARFYASMAAKVRLYFNKNGGTLRDLADAHQGPLPKLA